MMTAMCWMCSASICYDNSVGGFLYLSEDVVGVEGEDENNNEIFECISCYDKSLETLADDKSD